MPTKWHIMAHQARKRFGQHFLTDESKISAIISAIQPNMDDRVIEIGPGLGAITIPLLGYCTELEVVEIDRDLVLFWQQKKIQNLKIHQSDALEFDFKNWAADALHRIQAKSVAGQVKIIGNLPYNISTPLLFHLMEALECVDSQVFMLQKEVVERMVASPGDSEYSRLSVMLQMRYDLKECFDVPPESFDPPPRVNSAVVAMYPKKKVEIDSQLWETLETLVAKAFSQRRKVLSNNLAQYKDVLNLDPSTLRARAQEISGEQYLEWARKVFQARA
jgi:16S rRNA (adenine1518-N6/adenine1519-N6)-dimethyltransferase